MCVGFTRQTQHSLQHNSANQWYAPIFSKFPNTDTHSTQTAVRSLDGFFKSELECFSWQREYLMHFLDIPFFFPPLSRHTAQRTYLLRFNLRSSIDNTIQLVSTCIYHQRSSCYITSLVNTQHFDLFQHQVPLTRRTSVCHDHKIHQHHILVFFRLAKATSIVQCSR